MTTVGYNYKISAISDKLSKVEPVTLKKEKSKTTYAVAGAIAKTVAIPVVIYKNTLSYFQSRILKSKTEKFILELEKVIDLSKDEDKVELYASFSFLHEFANEIKAPETGGFLTKEISTVVKEIVELINKYEPLFYKTAYPNSPDPKDPKFIEYVKNAHLNHDIEIA
jgi:hypothetical protein